MQATGLCLCPESCKQRLLRALKNPATAGFFLVRLAPCQPMDFPGRPAQTLSFRSQNICQGGVS